MKALPFAVLILAAAVVSGAFLSRHYDIFATHGSTTPSYAIDTVIADNTYTFVFDGGTSTVTQNEINIGSVTPCSEVTTLGSAFSPHRFDVVGKTFSDAGAIDFRINHDSALIIQGFNGAPFSDGVSNVGFMNLFIDPGTFARQPFTDAPSLNFFLDASTNTSFYSELYTGDRTFARSPDHSHVHSTAEPYEANDEWVVLARVNFFFAGGTPEGVYTLDLSNTPPPGAAYTSLKNETTDAFDIVNAPDSQLFDGQIALDLAGGADINCPAAATPTPTPTPTPGPTPTPTSTPTPPPPPTPMTFTVNSAADPGDSVCDASECTLREAINAANANLAPDTIAFNIPGAGPHTIQPTSVLPTITDPVTIDGYTQPGASPNTNGPGLGSNAVLKIELDGSMAGAGNGLVIVAGSSTVRGLVINRFGVTVDDGGIVLALNGGNVIEGNYIGTDVTGTGGLRNSARGVTINGGQGNVIGGTTPGARNVISDHVGVLTGGQLVGGNGVVLNSATATLVQGNFIGTDATGTAAIGNSLGVSIVSSGTNNVIGGTAPEAGNVISGNFVGILILEPTGNTVQGNYIGTDVTGTADLGNVITGVEISGSDNVIGGATPGAGNVISGNGRGVDIVSGTGNEVQGNFIGTDTTGTAAIGNGFGVRIVDPAANNVIGGTTPGAGNVISGNATGILIFRETIGNAVQGNYIGTDVTGTNDLGNRFEGVELLGTRSNTVGGTAPGAGNTIAFNGGEGVYVRGSVDNAVLANSIFANAGLGIDLFPDGVTPNDAGDGDTGANNLQNFPVLSFAASGSAIIEGTLNSTPNTEFRVEFFSNSACDPSGFGEGETFLGSTMVTTDGSGNAGFTVTFLDTIPVGHFINSTATDPDNNTSEFSQCEPVVPLVDMDIKPGSDPNSTNLRSTGVIPVAILSTPGFDADSVDPATVVFARPGGASPVHDRLEDVDGDGDLDLIMHFRTRDTAIEDDATVACLTGETFGGQPITGCDTIRIVPPWLDSDGDGWGDAVEATLSTDQFAACPRNSRHAAHPVDFNNDGSFTGFDLDAVAASIGLNVPPAPIRKDIGPDPPDGQIAGADLDAVAARIGETCTP